MHSFRFFVPKDQIPVISGTDVHHIKDVLRMQPGDGLTLLDGEGTVYECKIKTLGTDKIDCEIVHEHKENKKSTISVTVAQALPFAKKMNLIVQKLTELGAKKIIPLATERSVGKVIKKENWEKIAKEAAQQCGRRDIPKIDDLTQFDHLIKNPDQYDLKIVPWELEKNKTLKSVLSSKSPKNILIVIGPEAGLSRKEVEEAKKQGFVSVSLGDKILRTETAGMAILSMLLYQYQL